MQPRGVRAPLWAVISLCALASGCGNRATVERSTVRGEDVYGERTTTTASSITVHGSAAEAELARAKAIARDGAFAEAIRGFRSLYQDLGNPEPLRAEALLRWAEAEGSLLNPQRDLAAAIERLGLFREEFPESPLLPEAEASLQRLRDLRQLQETAPGDSGGAGRGQRG